MALFENFPYTNLHQLNLDWLIQVLNDMQDSTVLSVNGKTGDVILYTDATVQFPEVSEDHWSIIRMADGTNRGILFGNDDKAYIVHGNIMAQIYSQNNQPPYPVTSVNGQTGTVVLYSDQYVQLPALSSASMHSWSLFRKLNSTDIGIDFDDSGDASIIYGVNRYKLFTENNPPFTDNNGAISFDPFTNPNYEGWILQRSVNGTIIGLGLNDDGTIEYKVGEDIYTVYTSNDGIFLDPSDSILELKDDATDYSSWGLVRETANGKVGIVFDDTDPDTPVPYMIYVDSNNQSQSVQLLTIDDIPAGAGVVTINGQYGVVTLYATDINMANNDSTTIKSNIDSLKTRTAENEAIVAYPENGSTSSDNYSEGQYIVRNGLLYKVINNISSGDSFSATNVELLVNIGHEVTELNSKTAHFTNIHAINANTIGGLNNAKTPGFYGAVPSTLNIPASGYYSVLVMPYTVNDLAQIAVEINSGKTYVRAFHDGTTWTAWKTAAS